MTKQSAHPVVVLIFLLQVRRGRVMHSGQSGHTTASQKRQKNFGTQSISLIRGITSVRGTCRALESQTDGGLFCFIVIG